MESEEGAGPGAVGPQGARGETGERGEPGAPGQPWDSGAALDSLVAATSRSNWTMTALLEEIRLAAEARDKKIAAIEEAAEQSRLLSYLATGGLVLLLILGVVTLYNVSLTNSQNADIAGINETLLDCVNSTGDCGRVNAASQAKILDTVKQYELTGFYCIRTNPAAMDPTGEALLACMERLYPGGPTLKNR